MIEKVSRTAVSVRIAMHASTLGLALAALYVGPWDSRTVHAVFGAVAATCGLFLLISIVDFVLGDLSNEEARQEERGPDARTGPEGAGGGAPGHGEGDQPRCPECGLRIMRWYCYACGADR